MTSPQPWVYTFCRGQSRGDPQNKDLLGGKGAGLAAMSRAGLPVPPGFTISTECCRGFLASGGRWPEGLEQEVRDNLAWLEEVTERKFAEGDNPLLVSVRSGAAVSMPGMMDTILNCGLSPQMSAARTNPLVFWRVYSQFVLMFAKTVGGIPVEAFQELKQRICPTDDAPSVQQLQELAGEYGELYADRTGRALPQTPWAALVECIDAVFNSWNSQRAIVYRREHGISGLPGTAVTVQAMFPSQVSGVAFTTNPTDPALDEMIIESSFGLGEAIVSGDVHPDHFVVDRKTLSLKRSAIGNKKHVVQALGELRPHDPGAASLTEGQVGELARIAMEVERFFARPMDIEWGLADGQFALLQARPIRPSRHAAARARLLESARRTLREGLAAGRGPWVVHNLAETLPHPTPLTWSLMRRFMSGSGGFGAMYRMAGFEPSPRASREGFLELVAGRIYMDAAAAGEMFFQDFPFRYDLNLLKYDPDAALAPPTIPRGSIRARIASGRKVSAANRKLRQLAEDLDGQLNSRIIPDFVCWCEQQRRQDLTGLSGEDLVGLWREREIRVMDEFAPLSLLPSLISGMALADLRALLAENFWRDQDDIEELAGELAATATPDKTMQLNADLYALARGRLNLDDWMSAHGHRAMEEFDLSAQRWRERPDEVLKMAARLKDGPDPMELYKARREGITGQLESLRAALRPVDRGELDRQVALARRYMIFRENGKYYLMLGYALLRDAALEAGRRLGLGEDVFLLTAEEMQDALRTGTVPTDALAERKAEHRAASRLVLPRVIDAAAVDALGEPPKTSAGDHYPAVAVSAGVASGPVRIVRSPHSPGDLGRGYILVCASTDPAWTPLFVGAAGLVMECGGTLSHGALVAREMGIPAVVLPGAMELFRPGETVFVDGRHGRVGRHAATEGEADSDRPADDDVRIAHALAPPPRGRAERKAAKWRRAFLIGWGAYLLAAFLLPDHILYQPSLRVLDAFLWPLTGLLGRTGVVVLVAAVLAVLTMVGQRWLTDQPRIREAKRRAAALARQAASLPRESPRRQAMTRLAGQAQVRLLGAALVPLALLLGPMVMTFAWFPARVGPASWNAAPGSAATVVAAIDSEHSGQVRISVPEPLRLSDANMADREVLPIRQKLWEMLDSWSKTGDVNALPVAVQNRIAADPDRKRRELESLLEARGPSQDFEWRIQAPPDAAGRFPVTVTAGEESQTLYVVLGDQCAPDPRERQGDSRAVIRSVSVTYPPPDHKRVFWAPLDWLALPEWNAADGLSGALAKPYNWVRANLPFWDAGWLILYLIVYLPVMFAARWVLKVA